MGGVGWWVCVRSQVCMQHPKSSIDIALVDPPPQKKREGMWANGEGGQLGGKGVRDSRQKFVCKRKSTLAVLFFKQ